MFDLIDSLEWDAVTPFDSTHYVSGIYKLTSYTYFKHGHVPEYWRAYMVMPHQENWGEHLPGHNKDIMYTLAECKAQCAKHSADYVPSNHQIKVAARSADYMRAQG